MVFLEKLRIFALNRRLKRLKAQNEQYVSYVQKVFIWAQRNKSEIALIETELGILPLKVEPPLKETKVDYDKEEQFFKETIKE